MVESPRWLPLIRLCVVVEGRTELEFVKWLLADHLEHRRITPRAVSLHGNVSVQRLGRRMADMYRHFDVVTSLVDFYGFRMSPQGIEQLDEIASRFAPEDIDDDPRSAPSKRIAALLPDYDKVVGGNMVASEVGLSAMRTACPRFNAWITRLEALANE